MVTINLWHSWFATVLLQPLLHHHMAFSLSFPSLLNPSSRSCSPLKLHIPVLRIPRSHPPCPKGISGQPTAASLPPSPGQSETEAEADKVVRLIIEEVVDDAVAPSLRVAGIRGRQTCRPQNEVIQGA